MKAPAVPLPSSPMCTWEDAALRTFGLGHGCMLPATTPAGIEPARCDLHQGPDEPVTEAQKAALLEMLRRRP